VELHIPSSLQEDRMVALGRPEKTLAEETKKVALVFSLVLVTAAIQSTPAIAQNARAIDSADFDFQLGAATSQALGFTVFQHAFRLREEKTRQELGGAFLHDWFKSASHVGRTWNDEGKVFTNYVAHPQGGALYAHIYRQNDPRRRRLEVGEPGYGGMVARALIFSAAVSTQFEIGPVSEASIGNVGMRNATKMAWVDLVVTPVLGTAWMVGEDVIDERILRPMDGANPVLRNTVRFFLNPSRSGANLTRRKWPWFRDRDASSRVSGQTPARRGP
jgi:hypothetical protein